MIAHLSGKILFKSVDSLTVDVGGVGYEVHVPLSTFYAMPEEGSDTSLLIYTHVKEDAIKLFGFITPREKELFVKLIGVSGVGPKLALNILSGIESDELARAIKNGDTARMNAIPGVGKKTADRLILELKEKITLEGAAAETGPAISVPAEGVFDDALSALVNLGYKKGDVEKALNLLKKSETEKEWTVETLLKESLRIMAK